MTTVSDTQAVAHPDDQARESGCVQPTANAGRHAAWEATVRRHTPYLMRLASSYRLGDEAHDAVQNTFLRLLDHADSIRKPESVQWWLAAVLRRECLALLARRGREHPIESETLGALMPADDASVDAGVIAAEDASYVRRALGTLPPRQRDLLVVLSHTDDGAYRVASERMDIPLGSIGPTRRRALTRMREALADAGYDAVA